MPSLKGRTATVTYSVITVLGLAYAVYRGYLFPLAGRLSAFDHWQVGDWLIDYSGGVVRRGLSGEIVFLVAPGGTAAITTVVVIQTALAAALFILVGALYWRTDRGPVWMMLVLSPAFLLFPALDATGNTRKELLVLVALGIAALFYRSGRSEVGLWIAVPLFVLGVFSHEALAVTLPAFAYLAFTSLDRQRAWRVMSVYAIAAIGALLLALVRPGNAQTAALICASWNERGITDCGGALAALGMPAGDMVQYLVTESYPTYWAYLLPLALATLPFFALRFWPRERLITIITIAAVAPLFVLGWDYGRWIFLIVAQLSLIALARPDRTEPMRVPLYGALAFILLWGFNHSGQPTSEGLGVRWLASLFS